MENYTGLPDELIEELSYGDDSRSFATSKLESNSGIDIRVIYFAHNGTYYKLIESGHKESYDDYHTWSYDGLVEVTQLDMIKAHIQYNNLVSVLVDVGWENTARSFLEDILDKLTAYTLKHTSS